MQNHFYTDFDFATQTPRSARESYRTPFEIDRDRIIHTSAFRRMQAKTQVFQSGEYDFYRTRLTHSIEVAQIGRSICAFLKHDSEFLGDDCYVDPDLVEAICLSHDLGHPPFGHNGERALNQLMKPYGGFEGNAQTLRLITETIYQDGKGRRGMQPTRALLDGVLKYKSVHSEWEDPDNHFLFDEQAPHLEFVFDGKEYLTALPTPEQKNAFKSLECQIMDWADDTAYSIHDIADGIRAGFITRDLLERWAERQTLDATEQAIVEEVMRTVQKRNVDAMLGYKVGEFIKSCKLVESDNLLSSKTKRHKYRLVVDPTAIKENELFKKISFDIVFLSTRVKQLEFKGNRMLEGLFDAFFENYIIEGGRRIRLVPEKLERRLEEVSENQRHQARLLCDYIAGMTDSFAIKTYQRLYDPGFGSILDLV